MKILFLGLCKFKNTDSLIELNPFQNIKSKLEKCDLIVLNMEGIISNNNLKYNSKGEQLLYLKKMCGKKPIYINYKNEHMLVNGDIGITSTTNFLSKNNFYFSSSMFQPFIYDDIAIFNMIDCDVITNSKCISYILPFNINLNFDNLILRFLQSSKCLNKTNIILYKTSNNFAHFKKTAKKLITVGFNIIIGYGDIDVNQTKYESFLNGIMIYNLGIFFDNTKFSLNNYDENCMLINIKI